MHWHLSMELIKSKTEAQESKRYLLCLPFGMTKTTFCDAVEVVAEKKLRDWTLFLSSRYIMCMRFSYSSIFLLTQNPWQNSGSFWGQLWACIKLHCTETTKKWTFLTINSRHSFCLLCRESSAFVWYKQLPIASMMSISWMHFSTTWTQQHSDYVFYKLLFYLLVSVNKQGLDHF